VLNKTINPSQRAGVADYATLATPI